MHLSNRTLNRKVVFDLYCKDETGERFLVEIEKTKQIFLKIEVFIMPLSQ